MKKFLCIIGIVAPIVAVILVVIQVVVSNELATLGGRMGELDRQIVIEADLKMAKEIEIASASSLMTMRTRASELGFLEPTTKQILYLPSHIPVAFDNAGKTQRTLLE